MHTGTTKGYARLIFLYLKKASQRIHFNKLLIDKGSYIAFHFSVS